ncbi:MAG: aspartate/glutamate racemase family protein [Pseudomonadota bacterium]
MRKKTYYGVTVGILIVDSSFRRFVGDIGNAETWPFPVQYRVVRGATPAEMVNLEGSDILGPFKAAADELIADGVDGIATTCGFLALYQKGLAEHCPVPVATSALLQVPMVERLIPAAKRVGVLTYSAEALASAHLEAVGVDPATTVVGMPRDSEFYRWIMEGDASVPFDVLKAEVVDTAQRLVRDHPETGAIVNECTNLTPFSADIAAATGLPVFDMVTMMQWFHTGLRPPIHRQ